MQIRQRREVIRDNEFAKDVHGRIKDQVSWPPLILNGKAVDHPGGGTADCNPVRGLTGVQVDYERCLMLHNDKYLVDVDGTVTDWEGLCSTFHWKTLTPHVAVPQKNGGRGSDYYFFGQTLQTVTVAARALVTG